MKTSLIQCAVITSLLTSSSFVMANTTPLQQSQQIETRINHQASQSQSVVAKSSDNAIRLQSEVTALQKEVRNLQVYQTHLQGLIESQNEEMTSFDHQLSHVDDTKKSIVPLMYAMLDGLSNLVENDKPIRQQTRMQRIVNLQHMMVQANVSDAEKYRRILEAYQIELDYGTKLGTYTGVININNKKIMTEQLYAGRLSLIARTSDKQSYWAWDQNLKLWKSLPTNMVNQMDMAFKVANKQVSPSLIQLPVSLNTVKEQE